MSLRVNNSTAFSAYTNLTSSSNKLNSSMSRLSKGIKSSVDDAAGVGISERMRAQARGTAMARQNVENGISALQTADSWMQGINDMLGRMKELAVESGDVTMSADDKANINVEYKALSDEIGRIADNVEYNGQGLLNGSLNGDTVVDADGGVINIAAMTLTGLDTSLGSVAAGALAAVGSAIDTVTTMRATLGATQNRFENTRAGLLTYEDNIRAAESKIRDVDMARESSNMVKEQILSQVGNAMLTQANQLPQGILQLIG